RHALQLRRRSASPRPSRRQPGPHAQRRRRPVRPLRRLRGPQGPHGTTKPRRSDPPGFLFGSHPTEDVKKGPEGSTLPGLFLRNLARRQRPIRRSPDPTIERDTRPVASATRTSPEPAMAAETSPAVPSKRTSPEPPIDTLSDGAR